MAPQKAVQVAKQAILAPDPYRDLAPFAPSASDPWDAGKVRHLMRRAGFGAVPEDVSGLVAKGMDKVVDELVNIAPNLLPDSGYATLANGERAFVSTLVGARAQWIQEMRFSKLQLQEKLALFWSDHFSVGAKMREHEALLVRHINVLRQYGLGRFKDLLLAVTKDPAMLWWLDNNVNGKLENGLPKINENYGRELLELYTMGEGNGYTQADVRAAAACLTGWSTSGLDRFVYKPQWHVNGDKTFLGKTIRSNGQREVYDLIDRVLEHPAASRYVVTKIWNYFVSEAPYPQLIEVLARMWKNSGYDIAYLLRVIFKSQYFYSSRAVKTLVKNPVEFVIQPMRTLHATTRLSRSVDARLLQMGYRLMGYSDPSGFDDGVAWIDEMAMLARANYGNDISRRSSYTLFQAAREINRLGLNTKEKVVDHYLEVLGADDVPPNVRGVLYLFMDFVDTGRQPFQFTAQKIEEKVRGLVHLIISLPEFSTN